MRQTVADNYNLKLKNLPLITPDIKSDRTSVWAQYTIRSSNRDDLQEKLKQQGISTAVHYPMPLHQQECFQYLMYKTKLPVSEQAAKEVMSLPMNPFIRDEEQDRVSNILQ